MAYASDFSSAGSRVDLPSTIRSALGSIRTRLELHRARRRLCWELNQYSDHQLADMGLSRSDIEGLAGRLRRS